MRGGQTHEQETQGAGEAVIKRLIIDEIGGIWYYNKDFLVFAAKI